MKQLLIAFTFIPAIGFSQPVFKIEKSAYRFAPSGDTMVIISRIITQEVIMLVSDTTTAGCPVIMKGYRKETTDALGYNVEVSYMDKDWYFLPKKFIVWYCKPLNPTPNE